MVRDKPLDALAINAVFEIGYPDFPTASCDGRAPITDRSMNPKPIYLAAEHPMTEGVHLIVPRSRGVGDTPSRSRPSSNAR